MNKAEFSHELIDAARNYLDKQAIYHQNFAGNCIEGSNERCLEDGIGPDRFDCSGLVIRSASDILGVNTVEQNARHVREMWQSACDQTSFLVTKVALGSLAVIGRRYTINSELVTIPGHIGIITNLENGINIVHANPFLGKVEERRLTNTNSVMGYISLDHHA